MTTDTQMMRVKDGMKEQVTSETQGEQSKTRRKIKGFGILIRTIGRFKKPSFKRDKKKSRSGSRDRIDENGNVDSTSESRDKLEGTTQTRISHTETRTTISSHFDLPSSNPQQKELLQLTTENMRLQDQINKANDDNKRLKHEILQQRMEFQQQKSDLEQQIQKLKQELTVSETAGMKSLPMAKHAQNKEDNEVSPMVVDFAGDVVPLDEGYEELKEEEVGADAFPGQSLGTLPEFQSTESDDDDSLLSPKTKMKRFISEDPRHFERTKRRSALSPTRNARRNTIQGFANKPRRQGLKMGANRDMNDSNDSHGGQSAALQSMGTIGMLDQGSQLFNFVREARTMDWLKTFRRSDPRFQILNFFDDIAQEGADNMEAGFDPTMASPLLRMFDKASVFTVWRPTSLDAIRRMMLGEGVGKGLDIKGKSAKRGRLSGYVPYLQIYEEEHKKMVKTHPKDGKIKVFFKREAARDQVVSELNKLAKEMVETFKKAKEVVAEAEADDDVMEWHFEKLIWEMTDTKIDLINDYAPSNYGMLVPERLFWEGMVVRQDISRDKDSEYYTGRPSEPNFQNMNSLSLRKEPKYGGPKTVILQYEAPGDVDPNPMDPRNLVMAYEENGRVMPVVSDFDCFLVGSRGVKYEEPMEEDQLKILKWCIDQIETVLDSGAQTKSWTSRWLDILKVEASKGFHPTIPPLGFSDPKSNSIMKHAISRLKKEGSVRHGAECFNYYFPQELDDEFLVISHDLPGSLRWCYVDEKGLQDVLSQQIDKGYTFPINPKWILCDQGWKAIYDKLIASQRPNVQDSLRMWYPPEMGIREKIEEIHSRHPDGFQRLDDNQVEEVEQDGTAAMDLAEQELRAYLTFQRAKRKLRGIFVWRRLLLEMRKTSSRQIRSSATLLGDIRQASKRTLDTIPG